MVGVIQRSLLVEYGAELAVEFVRILDWTPFLVHCLLVQAFPRSVVERRKENMTDDSGRLY